MAEIHVERKRGPGVWPWVAGLLLLALLVWGALEWLGGDSARGLDRASAPAAADAGPP